MLCREDLPSTLKPAQSASQPGHVDPLEGRAWAIPAYQMRIGCRGVSEGPQETRREGVSIATERNDDDRTF